MKNIELVNITPNQHDNSQNQIAVVDENDNIIAYEDKLKVHQDGILHRAFSIFIFNSKGEILIHKRAESKYHSPGLWTNTCCSHLQEGKTMEQCLHERLQFEMGFDTGLEYQFKFTYHKSFDNQLTEHETDHVYFGVWNGTPEPAQEEVATFKWIKLNDVIADIKNKPAKYTYWFWFIISKYANKIKSNTNKTHLQKADYSTHFQT